VAQECHMPLPAVSCVATQGMPANSAWKLVGKRPNGADVDFGDHIGRISKVLDNGCAFVNCPEVKTKHKRDAYIHSNVMEQCGLKSGDKISFVVHVNFAGAPQVSAPLWKHVGESSLHTNNGTHARDTYRDDGWSVNSVADNKQGNWHYKRRDKDSSSWWDNKEDDDQSSGSKIDRDSRGHSTLEDKDLFFGQVSMVNTQGQFAMVSCEDIDYDKDVYVHRTTADLDSLQVDDVVAFKLHVNKRGSPQASPPIWKLASRSSDVNRKNIGKYRGTVCKITNSGNAFVTCPELAGDSGRDVFVHETVARECCIVEGDEVSFCVHYGHAGLPQLSAPCWKLSMPGMSDSGLTLPDRQGGKWQSHWSGTASGKSSWDSQSPIEGQLALPAPATRPQAGDLEKVLPPWDEKWRGQKDPDPLDVEWKPEGFYVGTVCETSPEKGRSMVRCLDWSENQDVYVHKSVAEPGAIDTGDIVAFQIHVNAKGQPQASAPFWKQVGWRPKNKPVRFGKYQGLVARLLPHGCSFLECKEVTECYGRDAYVHHAVMKQCDLVEGNLIAFDVHVSSKGKPQVSAPCWICCSDSQLMRDCLPEIPKESRQRRTISPSRQRRTISPSRGRSREDNRRRRSRHHSRSCRKDYSPVRGPGSTTSEDIDRWSNVQQSRRRRDGKEDMPPLKRTRRNLDKESSDKEENPSDCHGSKLARAFSAHAKEFAANSVTARQDSPSPPMLRPRIELDEVKEELEEDATMA